MMLKWHLDPPSPPQLKRNNTVKVGPHLAKISGSAHADQSYFARITYCTVMQEILYYYIRQL